MPVTSLSRVCAFTASITLPRHYVRPTTTPCICMNAKRGAPSQKRSSKNKRSSSQGFDIVSPPKTTRNESMEENAEGEFSPDVQFEETSGAAGDATPHRAIVPGPASASMTNPEDDPLGPETDLIELPDVTNEERVQFRFQRLDLDETIELFAEARKDERFAKIIIANRDFVTEKLLYRFTSAILQVENRETNVETIEEEAANMRLLRKDLIAHCWSIDHSLKVEIQRAEARLLSVLQGDNVERDIQKNCGISPIEVDAFWIVIFAAAAAWEERGKENAELVNVDMQKQLKSAADACKSVKEVINKLSPSLIAIQKILTSSDPQVQSEVVKELDDNDIIHIGSLTEQIRLLPEAAYGALTSRMSTITDYILKAQYNYDSPELVPFRFQPTPTEWSSRLVNFAKTSRQNRRT